MSSHDLRFLSGLAILAMAGGILVSAQSPGPATDQPTFRGATDTVEVDVAVTDQTGRPIRGLTRADFTIPGQTITAFQEVSHDLDADREQRLLLGLPRDVSDNRTTREATLAVVVVDDRVPSAEQAEARAMARQIVDRLGPDVWMGLLWTSGRPGVELTEDRPRLLAAIDRVRPSSAPRVVRRTSVVTGTCSFSVFEQAARLLAPMTAQRKALVAISPYCGIDVKGAVDSMAPRWDNPMDVAAVQMVDVMRRANVAFFGIDPRGAAGFSLGHFAALNIMGQLADPVTTPQLDPVLSAWSVAASPVTSDWTLRMFDPVFFSQENLVSVAGATGGFAVTNTSDLAGGVDRLVDDFDHYYLLGFSPPPSERTGFHKFQVVVDRPDTRLRYRPGFQLDGVRPPGRSTPPLPTITGVMPTGNVPLRLLAAPFATGSGSPRELIAIEVQAPRALLVAGAALQDDASVTIVAVRTDEARVEKALHFDRHVTVAPAFAGGASDTVRYQIVRAVELPSGTYQLRVSLTSARMASTGSVYLSTDVPTYSQTPFEVGGPLLAYPDPQRSAAATLIDSGLPAVAPTFDRVFDRGETLRVICPIWRRPGSAGPTSARLDLLDEHGTSVFSSSIPMAAAVGPDLDATVSLAGVAPGAYRLRVTATDGSTTASREVGVAIR